MDGFCKSGEGEVNDMTAIEFIKENYTVTNGGEDYMCNHSGQLVGAEDIAEEYHQAKLKLLGMRDDVKQSEQLVCEECKEPMVEPYAERYDKKFCLGCM